MALLIQIKRVAVRVEAAAAELSFITCRSREIVNLTVRSDAAYELLAVTVFLQENVASLWPGDRSKRRRCLAPVRGLV